MVRRCAAKMIKGNIKSAAHFLEIRGHFIGKITRCLAGCPCRLVHFQAMLIGASDEAHITAHQPLKPGNCVGCDRFIGMTDMRLAIWIGYGGGNIKRFRHGDSCIFG